MTYLSDSVVTLRAVEPSDVDLFYRWENDTELWDSAPTIAPFSRQLLKRYAESYVADIYVDKQLRLMIDSRATGETVGTVDITDFDPVNRRASLGILVDGRFTRRGFGRAAVELVCEYAFSRLDMHQLWATVAVDNTASMAMFSACGFRHFGRLRSWIRRPGGYCDAYIMQRLSPRA